MFPFFISQSITSCPRSGYEAVTQPTINANTFLIFRTQKDFECLKTIYRALKKTEKKPIKDWNTNFFFYFCTAMNSSSSSVVTTEGFGNGNFVNLEGFFSNKGRFISAVFQTEKKPSAQHKSVRLEKRTEGIFRAGISFENLSSVKEGIANGERDEVGSLPFGRWERYPYTILHTPAKQTEEVRYVRLYPTNNPNQRVKVQYLANGVEVSKEVFASYLTPSERKEMLEGKEVECFNVKHGNLLKLGEPFNEG